MATTLIQQTGSREWIQKVVDAANKKHKNKKSKHNKLPVMVCDPRSEEHIQELLKDAVPIDSDPDGKESKIIVSPPSGIGRQIGFIRDELHSLAEQLLSRKDYTNLAIICSLVQQTESLSGVYVGKVTPKRHVPNKGKPVKALHARVKGVEAADDDGVHFLTANDILDDDLDEIKKEVKDRVIARAARRLNKRK